MTLLADPIVTVTLAGIAKGVYGLVNGKVWTRLYRDQRRKKGGCAACPMLMFCRIHVDQGHFAACEAPLQSEINGKLV